jgi:hypothetical protein
LDIFESLEKLKALILECGLPHTVFALFGIKCPYCGKSDRIHRLEAPEALADVVDSGKLRKYGEIWREVNPSGSQLGICKFCLNLLEIDLKKGRATTLEGT